MQTLRDYLFGFWIRFAALFDKTAILLIIPALLVLWDIDAAMFKTILQWVVVAPILAGIAVMVSRVIFHKVDLTKLIRRAEDGNTAAAIIALGVILSVTIIFLALVLWSKA